MPQLQNRQVRLAVRPVGNPKREDFTFENVEIAPLAEREVLVKVSHLSLDPAMRGWMNAGRSYIPPVELGEVMRAGGAGEVVESNHEAFRPGDKVTGFTGVQEYAAVKGEDLQKVDASRVPLESYLGGLGMPGMTAYFGLLDVCAMKEGDTVVVSGAAGAVGSIVGQLAKIKGGRAIGIAGGADKCAWVVDELGFDACVDYKSEAVAKRLREHAPGRINVYFDNVGGEILDICLAQIAFHGRIGSQRVQHDEAQAGAIADSRHRRSEQIELRPGNRATAVPTHETLGSQHVRQARDDSRGRPCPVRFLKQDGSDVEAIE